MKLAENTSTHTPCLIVGTGHNGQSVAAGLKRAGIEPVLLEQNPAIGNQWRERYKRLHLHHITNVMHLPGVPYPKHAPRFLSRLDFAGYLDAYARLNAFDVRLNHRVTNLSQSENGQWEATIERPGEPFPVLFTADQVVLACGVTGVTPLSLELEGRDGWDGQIVHSRDYHNAEGYEGKRVLVVGS